MPLIEREGHLRTIAELTESAMQGAGGIALVYGEAGIGKTTLLREVALLHSTVGPVWWGLCDPLHTPQPLGPLLGLEPALRSRWMPLLDTSRAALFAGIVDTLREQKWPVLFVFEDAHWADDATLDLLRFIGRRVHDLPVVLAITYRDDEVDARHPMRRLIGDLPPQQRRKVALPRLSAGGVDQLAKAYGRPPADIYTLSGGNPFFATEMLCAAEPGLPASVQDLVLARYAQLPPGAASLANLVSVVPGSAELTLIEAIGAMSLADMEDALASGLLEADSRSVHFRHELARVAVEGALSLPRSRALHAAVLLGLEKLGTASEARRVHHALRAGDRAAVGRLAPVAAVEAASRGANREAAAQWWTAINDGDAPDEGTLSAWMHQAMRQLAMVNRLEDAYVVLRRQGALMRSRRDVCGEAKQWGAEASLRSVEFDLTNAFGCSQRAVELLAGAEPELGHAHVWQTHALLLISDHRPAEAQHWLGMALDAAQRKGSESEVLRVRSTMATARAYTDRQTASTELTAILDQQRRLGDELNGCVTALNFGQQSIELGRWHEAAQWLQQGLAVIEANEWDRMTLFVHAWMSICMVHMGRWNEAGASCEAVLAQSALGGSDRYAALLALARLRVRRGDPGANALLLELRHLIGGSQVLLYVGPLCCLIAEQAVLTGDANALDEALDRLMPLIEARGHAGFLAELNCHMAALGNVDRHRVATVAMPLSQGTAFELEAAGRWREAADTWLTLDAPYERARALTLGDVEAQREALQIFERLGARPAADALRRRLREAGKLDLPRTRASTRVHPCRLTAAEFEVLGQLVAGLRNAEIAERLHRSVRTVDHHVAAVLMKLGVESRHQAVARAVREGWFLEQPA